MHLSFLISLGSFATLSVTVITPRTSHTGVWGGVGVCVCVCVCQRERRVWKVYFGFCKIKRGLFEKKLHLVSFREK